MATNRYCVDVAKRGTAGCKECKVKIEKGLVRIAKILPNPFTESGGDMKQWFHVRCIFEKLSRARATTKKIDDTDDIEGYDELGDEHKEEILKCLTEFSTGSSAKKTPKKTPKKTEKTGYDSATDSKDNSLREFRKLCSQLEGEPSYTKKTEIISNFFSKGSDGNGFKGNLYLWVKLLLPAAHKRVYNLQSKQLVKLFSEIFQTPQEEMLEDLENGDVAETIHKYFEESESFPPVKKSTLSLFEVDAFLDKLTKVSRESDQAEILTKVAKRCTSNDLKMFIRFIKHDLRINAGPKPVLTAIHPTAYEAFQASRDLEDIVKRSLENKGNSELSVQSTLMTPVLPMLAMACNSVDEAFKRFPNGFFVELKYDGERVQLHKRGQEFSYFSRSLKPVMPHKISHFKNYIPQAFPHGNNLILDCEILLVTNDGKPLPFGTLGAHKKTAFQDASVCLFVFDCLQYNDENLMKKPLVERKKILEKNMTPVKNHIMFSEMKDVKEKEELAEIIQSVIDQGLEGLVIKCKQSIYEPGKRHWLKVKKDYLARGKKGKGSAKEENSLSKDNKRKMVDTADLVVLGAYYGTGKKGGMMSIFLMGSYNPKTDKFYTVTKVHGGFSDAELDQLQKSLKMIKISKDPSKVPSWLIVNKSLVPDFVSEKPKESPVWEITGAEFSKAEIHTAGGISIRFPRVTRVRDDKTWKEATNVQELKNLYVASKQTSEIVGLSPVKKVKKENNSSPSPPSGERKRSSNSEIQDDTDSTPVKKARKETSSSNSCSPDRKNKTESSSSSSTENLPNVFSGMKLHIPSSIENADVLRRYFVAFDGHHLKEYQKSDANYSIIQDKKEILKSSTKQVTVDWLWACIKLQRKLPIHFFDGHHLKEYQKSDANYSIIQDKKVSTVDFIINLRV
ncbi:DNA ligase 3-like [Uloborus diversus]|uniref:DNA ligase 3-like n=1 Tax=Uloborus diversus TaxID=327109 RepID=UPI00240A2DEA|nr:DNA ligase 3-like [Uloborus diversus]